MAGSWDASRESDDDESPGAPYSDHMGSRSSPGHKGSHRDRAAQLSGEELGALGARVSLRDGSAVWIRQGRPSDGDLLVRGFYRLSPTSSYRRFLSASPLITRETVHNLTDIDHRDHEAMVALDERSGEGLGIAHYVRSAERPDAAEVAVTVIDDWQGRGLGTLLLEVISARARQEGITTFTALMLVENHEMRGLLERLGPVRIIDEASGTVEVEVSLPPVGVPPALRELLRLAGRHPTGTTD
jgi:GNAT superfamily N-acetyltransferase